jgi:proteasome lid subunit RPN8/RPN11
MTAPDASPDDVFILPTEFAAEIVAHARAGYPEEVCGIIAGMAGVAMTLYRGRNISPTPRTAYELDVETLAEQIAFEDAGLTLAAIYHSHPRGPEEPSPTDIARAAYPDAVHLIVSLATPAEPKLAGFKIRNGTIQKIKVKCR